MGEALGYASDRLGAGHAFYGHGTDNAWDEAVLLVLAAAGLRPDSEQSTLSERFPADALIRLDELLERRLEDRVPAPYLLGRAWFAGLEFLCDDRAIIPRSPLAELILDDFQPWYAGPGPDKVLDLCCGGGCIGLAVAHYYPDASVDLVDLDPRALSLARDNAAHLGVSERVRIMPSDLFAAVAGERYDLILSNPPYVNATDLAAMPAEYHHEPALALGSGEDGLLLTRRLLAGAGKHLEPHGLLVVEVGNSGEDLEDLYPRVPFTWIEFERGGHGVFTLTAQQWQDYRESLGG